MRGTATADDPNIRDGKRRPKRPWITPVVIGLYVVLLIIFLVYSRTRP